MVTFLNLIAAEPDIARVPVMVDSSKFSVIEAGLEMPARQAGGQFDLHEGRRGGLHRARQDRAPLRRRGGGDGLRRKGPGRHARAQDRDLPARLRHSGEPGRLPARGHHLRSRTSSPSPPAWRSTTITASTSSRRRAGSGPTCRTCMSPAACPICRSRSAATSACARPCIRCSCFTPSRPAWIWASSMPGRSRSMTTSIRNCARPARTWCSTAGPTPPSGCWRWRRNSAAPGRRRRKSISPGASGRWRSGWRTRWCTASPISSRPTSRRRARRPSARST